MTTRITITDLCDREAPYTTDLCNIDDDTRDVLYELMLDNDAPWFIGEFQYDEDRSTELPG